MDSAEDVVLRQLRKLREGPGLTTGRLERAGAVMSALGTSDPAVGQQKLVAAIGALGDSERARALKVDLGIDFTALVGRPAVGRELEWLGDRRSAYAAAIGRDVKTLSRWSDKAAAELRGELIADTFNGHLYIVAAVNGDRIISTSLIEQPLDDETENGLTKRISTEVPNRSTGPSMPCLVYSYPREWRPVSLTLVLHFQTEPHPSHVWATVADNIMKLSFGEERYALKLNDGQVVCRFANPRRDRLYGMWWRYSAAR